MLISDRNDNSITTVMTTMVSRMGYKWYYTFLDEFCAHVQAQSTIQEEQVLSCLFLTEHQNVSVNGVKGSLSPVG